MNRRFLLLLAAGGVLLMTLTGPAPGDVGACGARFDRASAPQHCADFRFWRCRREAAAGRLLPAELNACVEDVEMACQTARWPDRCAPTQAQSDACIALLREGTLINVSCDAVSDCELTRRYIDCDLCGNL